MAIPVYYTGDTSPALAATATDKDGAAVNIFSAASIRMVAKGVVSATVITGAAVKDDDGTLPLRGRWHYNWGASDLTVADSYTPELEVTWSAGVIETFRDDTQKFTLKADND